MDTPIITLGIETEQEYEAELERLHALMDAEAGSIEELKLVELSIAIEKYEKVHYPIGRPPLWWAILHFLRKLFRR
jgi:antitoxin component HigA of HigAB toxin-antitoxin module